MKAILNRLLQYQTLSRSEAEHILTKITSGEYNESQTAAFLTVFMMRPVSLEELQGFRDAMLNLCIRIDLGDFNTIDVCGTGGDGFDTFNISTLSAFVLAGAGEKVVKHGNYGVSSACGSSNIMEHFGCKFTNDESKLKTTLDTVNFCFLHAPLFNPAMKNVAGIRRQLGVKTFFNMLGPMVNPTSPKNQLIGVFSHELARLYNYVYQNGDTSYAIVHSNDGYDEISLTSPFQFITRNSERFYLPEIFGLNYVVRSDIYGGRTVEDSAEIFKNVISGVGTKAQHAVVVANTAAAFYVLHPEKDLLTCASLADETLLSGKALKIFNRFIEAN
jgi:anthranilate phosphoribosyltransferase